MVLRSSTCLAAVLALVLSGSVVACEKEAKVASAKPGGCSKNAQTVAGKAGCQKSADAVAAKVMKDMPCLTYRVGDFETCCPDAAAAKAGEQGKIQYKVADEVFDCRGKAMEKLAAMLEAKAGEMMAVSYSVNGDCYHCPMAAKSVAAKTGTELKYRLAGFDFETREQADAVANQVSEAVARLASSDTPANTPASDKSGCNKPCRQAQTADAKSGCPKAQAASAAEAKGGCGSRAKATTASGKAEGCDKAKAVTASGNAAGCDKAKAATASGNIEGCDKAKATTASADGVGGDPAKPCCTKAEYEACCAAAEARVAAAQAKLATIVETAQAAQASQAS